MFFRSSLNQRTGFWRLVFPMTLVLLFLALLPFSSALEIHHVFGEIDHDGHEHSDFDLCQWVKAHGYGSIEVGNSNAGVPFNVQFEAWVVSDTPLSFSTANLLPSRGPPSSS